GTPRPAPGCVAPRPAPGCVAPVVAPGCWMPAACIPSLMAEPTDGCGARPCAFAELVRPKAIAAATARPNRERIIIGAFSRVVIIDPTTRAGNTPTLVWS